MRTMVGLSNISRYVTWCYATGDDLGRGPREAPWLPFRNEIGNRYPRLAADQFGSRSETVAAPDEPRLGRRQLDAYHVP